MKIFQNLLKVFEEEILIFSEFNYTEFQYIFLIKKFWIYLWPVNSVCIYFQDWSDFVDLYFSIVSENWRIWQNWIFEKKLKL
jgi:hypothetical protein